MFSTKVGRIGACVGSVAAVYSISKRVQAKELVDCHECKMKRLPKARELPLYEKCDDLVVVYDDKSQLPLIEEISKVRVQVSGALSYLRVFQEEATHIYETGVAHSLSALDYITSEENKIPRYAAIASGGLFGIILARKGGYFKKLVYGFLGTGIVFSSFYPATSKEYILTGLDQAKIQSLNMLEKYGGYDAQKISDDIDKKVENMKETLKLNTVSNSMQDWFEKNKETVSKTLNSVIGNTPKIEKSEIDKSSG